MLWMLLLACTGAKDPAPVALDTALPSVVGPGTTDSATTPTPTGDTADWYNDWGLYIGPNVLDEVHQSCADGEWTYNAKWKGDDRTLYIAQWYLGLPPSDGDERGYHGTLYMSALPDDRDLPFNGYTGTVDYDTARTLHDVVRARCPDDVDCPRMVVAMYLDGESSRDLGDCVMFGADAEAVQADPRYHRAGPNGIYGVDPELEDNIEDCRIIPWPDTPTTV